MAVPPREQRIVLQKSGNRCAFPECIAVLAVDGATPGTVAVLGELAHIVGESERGPRGDALLTLAERNRANNLILLCNTHHQLIDDEANVATYTVERLHAIKYAHEQWVEKTLGRGADGGGLAEVQPSVTDVLYSNLLPVEELPGAVFSAPCTLPTERKVTEALLPARVLPSVWSGTVKEMAPFIVRGGRLFAFQDLRDPASPFAKCVDLDSVERAVARRWWDDPDQVRWYVDLLNRALNKLTGRRDLYLDRAHQRYYFTPEERGKERSVSYKPLNRSTAARKVVWQPKSKTTGVGRGYWLHRAVRLRFMRITSDQWCLAVRPELRVTIDGFRPEASERIGSRVTRKKSRMFNYDLLGEVQFWRDYLGESQPRIILPFMQGQRVVISTNLLSGQVTWPGISEEHLKPFGNIEYVDDLFTWGELQVLSGEPDALDWDDDSWSDEPDDDHS